MTTGVELPGVRIAFHCDAAEARSKGHTAQVITLVGHYLIESTGTFFFNRQSCHSLAGSAGRTKTG